MSEQAPQQIARIEPGALQRTWRSKHVRHEFERTRTQDDVTSGWYEVTDEEARYLATIRQSENPRSKKLFEISTKAEIDRLAAEERSRRAMGTHENPIGQKPGQYQPGADPATMDRLLALERDLAITRSTNQRLEALLVEVGKRVGVTPPPGLGVDAVGARPQGPLAGNDAQAPVADAAPVAPAEEPFIGRKPAPEPAPASASATAPSARSEKPVAGRNGAPTSKARDIAGRAGDLTAKLAAEGKISGGKPGDVDLADSPEPAAEPV